LRWLGTSALGNGTIVGGEHGPALVAFTGGTAFNGIVTDLMQLTSRVTHVLPVSDDGGSTAEIIRVLGRGLHSSTFLLNLGRILSLTPHRVSHETCSS
jgi:hypothetical protein